MAHQVRAVVSRSVKQPVEVVTINVPDPGAGEALVRPQATGVCHTDLHYREGGINDEFPFLLGHETAGIVEAVGEGVVHVAPGDFVVLNWRAVCGECRACRKGVPRNCFDTHNATQPMTLDDGTPLTAALGIGSFAELTLVAAGQCTKVPQVDPAAAGLLGCGVMAGFGAAVNTGELQRGETIAVFGCGGVGDAAIAGAVVAGATTIIAVDLDERKLEWAKGFGATHTVDASKVDPVEAIRELTHGEGAHKTLDCSSAPTARRAAVQAVRAWGTACFVGERGMVEFDVSNDILRRQVTLVGSWTFSKQGQAECAEFVADHDIAVDRLFTHRWRLDQAEEAYKLFDSQTTGKAVILPNG